MDGKCGCLQQPGMRSLGEEWVGATQGTKDDGGGTGQVWFTRTTKGRVGSEGGSKVRVPAFWKKVGH